jgi:phage RecT family recombinase
MTQQTQAVQNRPAQAPPARKAATIADFLETPKWGYEVQKVLPKGIMIDAMIRVARSAANDQKFAKANPVSFLQALLKCARAGLYPDGREAHLLCYGTDVVAIFDVKGIITLASRAGILVTPKLVHEKDVFTVQEDDGDGKTKVLHSVDFRKGRGELQLVYSRAVLPNGQVDYEFMTSEEVDHVRKTYSKAKDAGPWRDSFGEMAKKTVIKRHSKRWDMSPEIRQALNDDDDAIATAAETKVSAPIFTGPQKQVEAPKVKAKPDPVATPQPSQPTELATQVRALCEKADIGEIELIDFIGPMGMSDPDDKTLANLDEESLQTLINQWDEFADRIKEQRPQ